MIVVALLLLLLLLLFYAVAFSIKRRFLLAEKATPPDDHELQPNELQHKDLLTLIKDLGYRYDKGVCHGFTLTWAQEVVLSRDIQFYKRLDFIKQRKNLLQYQVDHVAEKTKLNLPLSKTELPLQDIRPFIESIILAQDPSDYEDFYDREIRQTDINHIMKMIKLKLCCEQQTVKSLFGKTYAFKNIRDLKKYLSAMEQLISCKDSVAIVGSSEEHTIGFHRHVNGWLFIDINKLYKQHDSISYQVLSSSMLANALYKSLFDNEKGLVFHCNFIAAGLNKSLSQSLMKLDQMFPITEDLISIENSRGVGLLTVAAQNGDLKVVRKMLSLHKKTQSISEYELAQAMVFACLERREAIVKQFLQSAVIGVNTVLNDEGQTAMIIAAGSGYTNLVKIFLDQEDIEIDKRDNEGMTALMVSCNAKCAENDPELFWILLKAGASITKRNYKGNTALQIAQIKGNQTAIDEISSYANTQTPKSVVGAMITRSHNSSSAYTPRKRVGLFSTEAPITSAGEEDRIRSHTELS
jgi:ankyrin repeat protein